LLKKGRKTGCKKGAAEMPN